MGDWLSAWNFVRLGLDLTDASKRCSNKVMQLKMFLEEGKQKLQDDVYSKTMFGQQWYSKCGGSHEKFFSKTNPTAAEKELAGLMASDERREILESELGEPYLVVSMEKPYRCQTSALLDAMFPKKSGQKQNSTKVFCIIKDEAELIALYKQFPPASRHMEEVISPSTRHKLFFDIERDFDDLEYDTNEKLLQDLRQGLLDMFIPCVCEYFEHKLGITLLPEECYVTDSSKLTSKFSVHIVISTSQEHYFNTRAEAWTVMIGLAAMVYGRANLVNEFRQWLFFKAPGGEEKCMWDFCVYGQSQRNMRLIGACKSSGVAPGMHWTECRVFQPMYSQQDAPFGKFIATVPPGVGTRVVITSAMIHDAVDFANLMYPSNPAWFTSSRKFPGTILNNHSHLLTPEDKAYIRINTLVHDMSAQHADDNKTKGAIMDGIRALRLVFGEQFQDEWEARQRNAESKLHDTFFVTAFDYLQSVGRLIHPGNSVSLITQVVDKAHFIAVLRMNHWDNRDRKNRCYFGCVGGNHMSDLTLTADFAVLYYCHRCKVGAAIVKSCIWKNCVAPRKLGIMNLPADFRGVDNVNVLDYSLEASASHYMRDIVPIYGRDASDCLGGEKSTTIMHGGMGTGKTQAVIRFLTTVTVRHPAATVVAFSFRKMLAVMFATSFKLENYAEIEEHSLVDKTRLAIQLESIERTGTPQEGQMMKSRAWDVVILDEIESVLQHFSSNTMKEKLVIVWEMFFETVKNCKVLVVCDADIGPRALAFLRTSRRGQDGVIKNLRYHMNRHIAIKTRFFDYASMDAWKNKLVYSLLAGENAFVFSNSRRFLQSMYVHIRNIMNRKRERRVHELKREMRMTERKRAREELRENGHGDEGDSDIDEDIIPLILDEDDASMEVEEKFPEMSDEETAMYLTDPEFKLYDTLLNKENTLLIDAGITGKEKLDLADCNKSWVKRRLVMISPTVGAGIDFTMDHFHRSFGYCIYNSCCARGINQMRGRCRTVKTGECHLAFKENTKYIDKTPSESNDLAKREGMPLTIADAEAELNHRHDITMSAMTTLKNSAQAEDVSGANTFTYAIPVAPIRAPLREVIGRNMTEQNLSKADFRAQLIQVLQNSDPDLWYEMLTKTDTEKDRRLALDMLSSENTMRVGDRARIASQRDLSAMEYKEAVGQNNRGEEPLTVRPGECVKSTLQKNKIRHFYGIKDNVSGASWKQIVRHCEEDRSMDKVSNLAFIIGVSHFALYNTALATELRPTSFEVTRDDGTTMVTTIAHRGAQEVTPGDSLVRVWTDRLMYINGFTKRGDGTSEFMHMKADSAECEKRLKEKENAENIDSPFKHQKWLEEAYASIMEHSNIKIQVSNGKVGNTPKVGEPWDWKTISTFTAEFLETWFGIKCYRTKPRELPPPAADTPNYEEAYEKWDELNKVWKERTKVACSFKYSYGTKENKVNCMYVDYIKLQNSLALAYCHLATPYTGHGPEPATYVDARARICTMLVANLEKYSGGRDAPHVMSAYVEAKAPHQYLADLTAPLPEVDPPVEENDESNGYGYGYGTSYGYGTQNHVVEEPSQGSVGSMEMEEVENNEPSQNNEVTEEEALERLRKIDTESDRKRAKHMACVVTESKKASDPATQVKCALARQRIIDRHTGGSPFNLTSIEYLVLLTRGEYDDRRNFLKRTLGPVVIPGRQWGFVIAHLVIRRALKNYARRRMINYYC